MNYQIYALCDPSSGKIHYIGQSNNAGRRLKEHMRSPAENVQPWIWQLGESGLGPGLVILETCPKEDKDNLEEWWLHWAIRKHQPILNTHKIPGWFREMNRTVEPCPYCGMFCGWTLRGGCNLGDKTVNMVYVKSWKSGKITFEGNIPMARCHICGEPGPIKASDYKNSGTAPVVKCHRCKRWWCRSCYGCNCGYHKSSAFTHEEIKEIISAFREEATA